MNNVLLTGASGFVGSHALDHLLTTTDDNVVCPVSFRHHGLPARIAPLIADPQRRARVHIVMCDLTAPIDRHMSAEFRRFGWIDQVWNIASESHVDRSIEEPASFIRNNVDSAINLLDWARIAEPKTFLHMSTDEVYGPAYGDHRHAEWEAIKPSNPYSASKAAQEAVAYSYWRTYGVPVVITNTMNIIGQRQDAEKFVPMVIGKCLRGEPIVIHTSPTGEPGSRYYLHAANLADAWSFLSRRTPATYPSGATEPDRYHIVGEREIDNTTLARTIHAMVTEISADKVPELRLKPMSFHESRPGHDLRYALDGDKIAALGWTAPVSLDQSLFDTVAWYLSNPGWLL